MSFHILLDQYPIEVIETILEYVQLEGLIQLIEHHQFLNQNLMIKAAMNNLICKSNIAFNNRVIQPSFLHMYCRIPTYVAKDTMQFLPSKSSLFNVVDYCNQECIGPVITVSFYIWTLRDIDQYLLIVSTLGKHGDSSILYNFELEFNPGLLYNLSLNYVFKLLATNLGRSIVSITVYNYSGNFTFDIDEFPRLENIWFEDSNIKFRSNFNSNASLKTLNLHPNLFGWNNNHAVHLYRSVPSDLKKLKLGNSIIKEKSIAYKVPQQLESLDLTKIKDNTPNFQYIKLLIEQNLGNCLKELSVKNLWGDRNQIIDLNQILFDVPENLQNLQGLQSFAIMGLNRSIDFSLFKLSSLTITAVDNSRLLDNCKFPTTLKKLDLSNNHLIDLSTIDQSLPENLQHLNLADNPIDWELHIPNFQRFTKLKYLKLSNTHLGSHLDNIEFPDSIDALSLEVNQIPSIENVKFPKNLTNLGIGSNMIKQVQRPQFPAGLQTIHLTENRLAGKLDLSRNQHGESLMLDIVYLNYTLLSNIQHIQLPNHIRILNFDYCILKNLSDIEFPASIVELSFRACEISIIKNISWQSGSRLRYICLSQNKLSRFDMVLPLSVETVNLAGNKLPKINPGTFSNLEHLQTLILSGNKLDSFIYHFNSISLRSLDLSFNNIRILNLSFPKNSVTELRSVNLCLNKISNLTPYMIGHDRDLTFHNKLIELDITDNKIKSTEMETKLSDFPASLKCMFVGYSGQRDRFGYDIAKNIIPGELCQGKRVDVPIHE